MLFLFGLYILEGKDIANIEMEDVELSAEGMSGGSVPEGCAASTAYNYMKDITNNLQASVVKPPTVTDKEKLDISMLCEDTVDDNKGTYKSLVVDDSYGSHQDNDSVNEVNIPQSSSGKFSQKSCAVPNSDSGFVDQNSTASTSYPDIKTFGGTLKSPCGEQGGGGGELASTSPAARTPLNTDSRILHHFGSFNTSSSDSSPGSQHQRSPSQQGWFAPPSPSIAPVLSSDSTVTLLSSCHQENNMQCYVAGGVSRATRTKPTMWTREVPSVPIVGQEVQRIGTAATSGNSGNPQKLQPQEEDKPVPPPRVSSVPSSGSRRSKLHSLSSPIHTGSSSNYRHGHLQEW